MRYVFKKYKDSDNKFDHTEITFESDSVDLSDVLEDFKCFLLACGFFIPLSSSLVVSDDELSTNEFENS